MGTLSAMFGLYGLAQHPILHSAAAIAVGGLAIVLIGLYINRPNSFTLAGMLLLIQALPRLIPGNPRIHLTTAIFVSLIFSTVTNWLGRIALQARRNKRLPNPTPHSARLARIGTPRRVD
jgi:membrane-bound ClpP family serine protease